MRVTFAVLCWPDGVTQVRDTVSPGRYFAIWACRLCGAPTAWPFTLVMADPAVTPAIAAGLPQIVPTTRVPELTGAIVAGTGRPVPLLKQLWLPDPFPFPPKPFPPKPLFCCC